MSAGPAELPFQDAARNLLFGLLALQDNFIGRDALIEAFGTWVADKSTPIDQVLLDQGDLDAQCHAVLMGLVRERLKLHGGDPDKNLEDLSAIGSVMRRLLGLGDALLSASLGHVPAAGQSDDDSDPDATASFVGAASAPRGRYFVGAETSAGGRFQVLRLHAEGGLGEVYLARDEEVHREVALKQIKDEHASDPQSQARFLVEAEITGGLEHPGIVPVYSLCSYDDGRPFSVMRFIKGASLKEAIERFHARHPAQAVPAGTNPGTEAGELANGRSTEPLSLAPCARRGC
jgi:hypothetical protein